MTLNTYDVPCGRWRNPRPQDQAGAPIDLVSDRAIEAIRAGMEQRRVRRTTSANPSPPISERPQREPQLSADAGGRKFRQVGRQRRCDCGTCTICLDNAKWERVFNEKFADPEYYKPRPTYHGSSLSWLK